MGTLVRNGLPQVPDPLTLACNSCDNGRTPRRGWPDIEHRREICDSPICVWPIGLVDDEDVGDLEQSSLGRLDPVTPAR